MNFNKAGKAHITITILKFVCLQKWTTGSGFIVRMLKAMAVILHVTAFY